MSETKDSSTCYKAKCGLPVPLEMEANKEFRRKLILDCEGSPELAEEIKEACRDDIHFYVNTFCFTFDPRKEVKEIPWISYPFQFKAFDRIHEAVHFKHPYIEHKVGKPLFAEKSRDLGWSWIPLIYSDWRYRFHVADTILLVSRSYDLVYAPGDPDTLFWKLDFLEQNMPDFLRPPSKRTEAHIENLELRGTIDGSSSNSDLGRGGRRTFIFRDEDAKIPNAELVNQATADATNCQIRVSTHAGPTTAFARDMKLPGANVITSHWSEHPEKAAGLYMVDDTGELTIIDREFWTPERMAKYEFVRKAPKSKRFKFRSPWYDNECIGRSDQNIATNLDIDEEGSESLFYDAAQIAKLKLFCRAPDEIGTLEYEIDVGRPIRWQPGMESNIKFELWTKLRLGLPARDRQYKIGVDVSAGTGHTNSTISVGDSKTREKVAAVATPSLRPDQFAALVAAVGWFFCDADGNPAVVIFEAQGPGVIFKKTLIDLGYTNLWRRKVETNLRVEFNKEPGWNPSPKNKRSGHEAYRSALADGSIRNYCAVSLDETLQYVYDGDSVEHVSAKSRNLIDAADARSNHGDRATADMLMNLLMNFDKQTKDGEAETAGLSAGGYPFGTLGWRRHQAILQELSDSYG